MCVIVVPIAARIGRARATSPASPPTMIERVPCCAPPDPPDTGASTKRTPRSLRRWPKARLAAGLIVEQSITSSSFRAPAATPSGPNRISSTSGVSRTQMTTTSLAAARRAGLGTSAAPGPRVPRVLARGVVVRQGKGPVELHRAATAQRLEPEGAVERDGGRIAGPDGYDEATRAAPRGGGAEAPVQLAPDPAPTQVRVHGGRVNERFLRAIGAHEAHQVTGDLAVDGLGQERRGTEGREQETAERGVHPPPAVPGVPQRDEPRGIAPPGGPP